eukprot:15440410-Alexandrium_andersonii.AAC.1
MSEARRVEEESTGDRALETRSEEAPLPVPAPGPTAAAPGTTMGAPPLAATPKAAPVLLADTAVRMETASSEP